MLRWLSQDSRKGFLWAVSGTATATAGFWLCRSYLDKGQASLLYLPVVIACAIRFGFGPAVTGALLSFLCWDFFFLPPFYTFAIANPRDWLSLIIFLITAITTAHLASQARRQAEAARIREGEALTLYQASEAISSEIEATRLLPALAEKVVQICEASRCLILRRSSSGALVIAAAAAGPPLSPEDEELIEQMAQTACEHDQSIGFGATRHLWARAAEKLNASGNSGLGVYVPLRVKAARVGAFHVGPRHDGLLFSEQDQRLILAFANHAAVVIARQSLADEAAQASALREADALKDALLSMVTHELRTPLAAIKAAASGLRQPQAVWPEAARAEALETIDVEADRLTILVSNLLDLSRLEAGAWNPSKDWCDLMEIVGTALDRLLEGEAARVQTYALTDLPLVRADYVQLALVFTNLFQNAAKYASPGSPIHLTLSSVSGERNAPGVRVDVRDCGAGIAAGDEEAIFHRFYRSVRHVDSTAHGTGLGLALCRAVVQAHGGRIWARNAPVGEPAGAVFSFFLPIE